eukprot:IDg7587t1
MQRIQPFFHIFISCARMSLVVQHLRSYLRQTEDARTSIDVIGTISSEEYAWVRFPDLRRLRKANQTVLNGDRAWQKSHGDGRLLNIVAGMQHKSDQVLLRMPTLLVWTFAMSREMPYFITHAHHWCTTTNQNGDKHVESLSFAERRQAGLAISPSTPKLPSNCDSYGHESPHMSCTLARHIILTPDKATHTISDLSISLCLQDEMRGNRAYFM